MSVGKPMLFSFLMYVKPIWYLRLKPSVNVNFVDPEQMTQEERELLDVCDQYKSSEGRLIDLVLQGWFKGIIAEPERVISLDLLTCRHRFDNYLFLRRFFNSLWSWYVLIVRIVTFHNPILEIIAFVKAQQESRIELFKKVKKHEAIKKYRGELLNNNTFVSVIIPTLNRYEFLRDTLRDLEAQNYRQFEVIVVDQSEPFNESFYAEFNFDLKVLHQQEKALWLARNTAVKIAKGDLILLFDDDSRVDADWIEKHITCLDYFNVGISSGVSRSVVGNKVPITYSFYKHSDQIDTGNVMIRREIFNKTGLFDRQFEKQRMGDAEFGLRCYLLGIGNISNPDASRIHLKVGSGGLREMGSWDSFRPKRIIDPRPIPSVLYYFRKYYGARSSRWALARDLPVSIIPYRLKGNKLMLMMGIIGSFFLAPFIFIQVYRSWTLSSQKLSKGAMIEFL